MSLAKNLGGRGLWKILGWGGQKISKNFKKFQKISKNFKKFQKICENLKGFLIFGGGRGGESRLRTPTQSHTTPAIMWVAASNSRMSKLEKHTSSKK
jgi:hypothetical protein